jgi:hypothetical protein
VNYSSYTQRPSSKENLNENLLRLATSPAATSLLGGSLPAVPWGPTFVSAVRQRSTLFEIIEPHTIKRPRKGKTSIRKFGFFRKVCEATREPQWRNRIIAGFGMPAQDAFDGLPITNLGGCGLGYDSETPALGRGRMGYALHVTEVGATCSILPSCPA